MGLDLSEKKNVFRKYDIRGTYPKEINEELVREITRALAEKFFKRGKVVLGRDGRNSSPILYKEAVKTFRNYPDIELIEAGIITTPCLFFLVNEYGSNGGMMITASHNQKGDNGIKVVGRGASDFGGEDVYTLIS